MIHLDDRTKLRKLNPADADALYAAIDRNRARLAEWLPWLTAEYGLADALEFLRRCDAEHRERETLTYGIFVEKQLAGAVGLHRIDTLNRASSIGYWLGEEFSGRGLMTAACRALVTDAFRDYGLHRIEIRCATGNHRSCAIPLRLGFTEEAILREAEWMRDHWLDLRVFSMLEQNWRV